MTADFRVLLSRKPAFFFINRSVFAGYNNLIRLRQRLRWTNRAVDYLPFPLLGLDIISRLNYTCISLLNSTVDTLVDIMYKLYIIYNLYNMSRTVTATKLKQETKSVLQMLLNKPDEPVVVSNYGRPQAVILNYEVWSMGRTGKPSVQSIRKFMGRTGQKVDSTKLVRQLRDEK